MLARLRASAEDREEGFTLIELLVVMVIIGILAAIAIPTFLNQKGKAYDTSAKNAIRTVALAEESYATSNQTYTSTSSALNLAATDKSPTTFIKVVGATTNGYCLEAVDSRGSAPTVYFWDSQAGGMSSALKGAACSVGGTFDTAAPTFAAAGTTTAPTGWF